MVQHVLVKLILLLSGIVWLLNTSFITLSHFQPTNPTLAGFVTGCSPERQPCWYGIVPGVTATTEAGAILEKLGYDLKHQDAQSGVWRFTSPYLSPSCVNVYNESNHIKKLSLYCFDLNVAETLAVLGKPAYITYSIDFGQGLEYGNLFLDIGENHLAYNRTVYTIYIEPTHSILTDAVTTLPWHTFAPFWRYCQFNPVYLICRY